jgi:hypothetical protein
METPLPVPVLDAPHWRVNFRPEEYNPEMIPSLSQCLQIIEQARVRLRGWDYPHLSHRDTERGRGSNWIASWSDFMGQLEYWRLYQSGQFLHLFSVAEATRPGARKELEAQTKGHLGWGDLKDLDWSAIPGFISLINFLYTVTEIFEFAARLSETGLYQGSLNISIGLKGIKGFVLTTEFSRAWYNYYAASEDVLSKTWQIDSKDLLAESAARSLDAVQWFFERFGWMSPPLETLRTDQVNFLKGRS